MGVLASRDLRSRDEGGWVLMAVSVDKRLARGCGVGVWVDGRDASELRDRDRAVMYESVGVDRSLAGRYESENLDRDPSGPYESA